MFRPLALLALFLFSCSSSYLAAQDVAPTQFDELKSIIESQNHIIQEQSKLLQRQTERLDEFENRIDSPQFDNASFSNSNSALPAIQNAQDAPPELVNKGYDGGFTLMGPLDGMPNGKPKFLMNIGSWGQLRHNYFDSRGPALDQNDIEFERLRLVFKGHAYNSNFQYFLQLDADADSGAGSQNVDMLDYYVTYDFGADLLSAEKKKLQLRFGRWKIGFNRAREESGTKMQFSDRSTPSVLFDFDRSMGIGLLGQRDPWIGESLNWEFAVTNGIDNAGFRTGRLGQLDRNLGVAARANWLLTGDWGKDGHADLDFRQAPAIRLGSGFTYTRPDREALREFAFPKVVDTGASIATVLPASVSAYNLFMFANDFNLKYQGFSLISETYFRQITGFSGGSLPSFSDFGWWFETGYFIVPQKFQLITRYAHTRGDSSTLGLVDTTSDEYAAGMVWYFNKHNSKLTFDITSINGSPIGDSALGIRAGDDGFLYRTTYQWKF